MRMIIATVLLFISTAVLADNSDERTWAGQDSARTPTATDVISGLYAFGRFQRSLLESADLLAPLPRVYRSEWARSSHPFR